VTWLLLIPLCLGIAAALTWWADRDLKKPAPPPAACEHPWFIDGRCMVCGTPKW